MFEMVPGLLSLITPCVVGAVYTVWGIKELRHQSKLHKHELQEIEYREECEKQERRRQQVAKNRPPCYTCAQLIIGCANGCQIKRNERDEATRFQCKFFGRRSTGRMDLRLLDGTKVNASVGYKNLRLLNKRGNYLVEQRKVG